MEPTPHDILKAYWRMAYVAEPKKTGEPRRNPFVDLPQQDDREALILLRGEVTYLMLNRYPYNPGHCMVLPYREVGELADCTPSEQAEIMQMITQAMAIIRQALRPDGFNVGFNFGKVAGAGIPQHLHGHIVPRWNGDSNFLPVIGETRTLPQALDQTWEALRAHC